MLSAYISGTKRDTGLYDHSYERYNDSVQVKHHENIFGHMVTSLWRHKVRFLFTHFLQKLLIFKPILRPEGSFKSKFWANIMESKSSELSESPRVHRAISFRCRDIRAESCRTFGNCHFGCFEKELNRGNRFQSSWRTPEAVQLVYDAQGLLLCIRLGFKKKY